MKHVLRIEKKGQEAVYLETILTDLSWKTQPDKQCKDGWYKTQYSEARFGMLDLYRAGNRVSSAHSIPQPINK
jgi:hypothetical protein